MYQPLPDERVVRLPPEYVGYTPASPSALLNAPLPPRPQAGQVFVQTPGTVVPAARAYSPAARRAPPSPVPMGARRAASPVTRTLVYAAGSPGGNLQPQLTPMSPMHAAAVASNAVPQAMPSRADSPAPALRPAPARADSPLPRQGQTQSPPPLPIAARQVYPEAAPADGIAPAPWEASKALQAATGEAAADAGSNQFMDLLESLEARVDLMAQMQHTRAAIQKRARALEGLRSGGNSVSTTAAATESSVPGGSTPKAGSASTPVASSSARTIGWQHTGEEGAVAPSGPDRRSPRTNMWSATDVAPGAGLTAPEGLFASSASAPTVPLQPPKEGENAELWAQFQEQRECIARLTGEVEGMRRQLLAVGQSAHSPSASTCTGSEVSSALRSSRPVETRPVPAVQMDKLNLSGLTPPMHPFSRDMCGVNLELSEDGYTASRTRGCRQAAAIGGDPLAPGANGLYFEVTIDETVTGWVGGLGIGVTATSPAELRKVPDKAWRMPGTYMVGYWGCIFLDGVERRTTWRSDSLTAGSVVGLLVTRDGDLLVFVDNTPVVRVAKAVPGAATKKLHPVADVFAATRAITLSRRADPPPPPWCVETITHTPTGSPRALSALNDTASMTTMLGPAGHGGLARAG